MKDGGLSHVAASNVSPVSFFGGPDHREALAFGQRMSNHPGITLVAVSNKVFQKESPLDYARPLAIVQICPSSRDNVGASAFAASFFMIFWAIEKKSSAYPSMFDPLSVVFVALVEELSSLVKF